jgi:MOSC domain-containing protein YiiM
MATHNEGTVRAIFLKVGHGQPMTRVDVAQAHSGQGLSGDVSFGRPKRQVLAVEAETLASFGLAPGDVRENLTLSGVRLAGAPAGTLVHVGGATLEVTMDCAPCSFIDGLRNGLASEMDGRRGTLMRVVEGGTIHEGDRVTLTPATESAGIVEA